VVGDLEEELVVERGVDDAEQVRPAGLHGELVLVVVVGGGGGVVLSRSTAAGSTNESVDG